MGEVELGVEFGGGPDFPGFDPAMIRRVIGDEIGFLSILEIELDILKKCGLIAFDGEVVMGLTIQAQIIGELTLGQEGIGRRGSGISRKKRGKDSICWALSMILCPPVR